AGYANAVFALPDHPTDEARKPPPPRLGVQLEAIHGKVEIIDVMHGSLARQTGLKPGDQIVSIGGREVTGMDTVIDAIHAQPPGSWLPVEIRRDRKTVDLVIKFPAKQ